MKLRVGMAVVACLALVASVQVTGVAALRVKDVPVITGDASVSQIAASPRYIAWSQSTPSRPNQSNLFVKPRQGIKERVNAKGTEGSLGGFDGRRLIYQQFTGSVDSGKSAIEIVNLKTGKRRRPDAINSRHWDFWPTLDNGRVLYGRTNPNTGRTKVLLTNLRSGNTRVLDESVSTTYFQPGQVNGRFAVWVRWKQGSKARAFIYNIKTGNKTAVPASDAYNWAPSVTSRGVVYFGRSGRDCGARVKILKWSKRKGTTRLLRLPDGIDISDSYVSEDRSGDVDVFHTRIDCDANGNGDAYRLRITRTTRPQPSPSPTPTASPTPEGPTLTVEIEGDGSVTSDPDGIDCGDECEATFEEGTEITLTAVPDQGSRFEGWDVPGCTGRQDTCTFELNDDMTVTASFR